MSNTITIDGRKIGSNHPPYVICELSANHNGSYETAIRMIDAAHATGSDAIKIQTYLPATMTLDAEGPDFYIEEGLWKGRSLYNLYEEAFTPWEWHKPMFDHAGKLGITMFSTPFDSTAVDLLEDLNAPAYKIASFEAIDLPLIRYVAGTGKPMIISTGMADAIEIGEAIEAARDGGCKEIAVLHCVSGYPAPAGDYNLRTIPEMMTRFGVPTGLSDHTLDNTTAIASVALGSCIIEKHFTLDRSGGGPDDSFSLEPMEFKALCDNVRTAYDAMGQADFGRKSSELGNVRFRRSLYAVKDIEAGDPFTTENVRSIRPGFGMAPKHLDDILTHKAAHKIARGTALKPSMLAD